MYPDPITPRAHPDLLSRVEYDPFSVMPGDLPSAPRVFANASLIERARQRLSAGSPVDKYCFDHLIKSCKIDSPLPALKPADGPPDWGGPLVPWLDAGFHNALAWKLTDDRQFFQRAVEALRLSASACKKYPSWTGHEHNEAVSAGRAYDLLTGSGIDSSDDVLFREMLGIILGAMDNQEHRYCNNHNSMQMTGRLSLAVALGDRQSIHDLLYGCERDGKWRYGLIHLLRHDFLSDGMDWEGAIGYHIIVLGDVYECFTIMENTGVNLWHRQWPSLMQNDGFDEHRGWGPKGVKSLTSAFDALLYQMFSNGDYSLLHDQVLGNLAGACEWWLLFNKAYEVYGDPRYAWALRHINRGKAVAVRGPVPVWFENGHLATDFVRIESRDIPDGEHPFKRDYQFALTGRHTNGCSLFPADGSAVLRSDALNEKCLGARLCWGPHWAGHQAPASLHLDIHALGRRVATAPHLYEKGYGDPRHLTWLRSTIAHNTVTVDEQSMFPYDFESESLWECDRWRDSISDGNLELFQPEAEFKAVRASNNNVYPGVKLDRTVIVTQGYLIDVYRVTAEKVRLLDWVMHCHGTFENVPGNETLELGQNRGYRHFTDVRLYPQSAGWVTVPFVLEEIQCRAMLWMGETDMSDKDSKGSENPPVSPFIKGGMIRVQRTRGGFIGKNPATRLIVARDPEPDGRKPIGDFLFPEPRTALIARKRTASALFVSIWSFGDSLAEGETVQGASEDDVTIGIMHNGRTCQWFLPMKGDVELLTPRQ